MSEASSNSPIHSDRSRVSYLSMKYMEVTRFWIGLAWEWCNLMTPDSSDNLVQFTHESYILDGAGKDTLELERIPIMWMRQSWKFHNLGMPPTYCETMERTSYELYSIHGQVELQRRLIGLGELSRDVDIPTNTTPEMNSVQAK